MISILLATGFEKLDNTLDKFFDKDEKIQFFKQRVYFREGLSDSIIRNQPDIILLSDKLDGNSLSLEHMIRLVRKRHPETRIVFILSNKDNIKLRKLLFQVSVYDVFALEPKLNVKDMYRSFFKPNEWKDVAHHIPDLDEDSFDLDEDYILNSKDGLIIEEDYSTFETKMKQNIGDSLSRRAAFWSIRQQSGTTFLAINTALLLAQHAEQKILLIDFNPNNPNIHLQFNLTSADQDGNRNLAALCEDIDLNAIMKVSEIDDYVITHPFYPNLRILLGLTLKSRKPSQETLSKAFNLIVEYAKKEGYTSILFDVESGLEEPFIIDILRNVDVIINPITENPGNIIAVQKLFDREFGPFFLNYLDLKKLNPILNKSTQSEDTTKLQLIIQSNLTRKVEVFIPNNEEIFESVRKGSPLLKKQVSSDLMRQLMITANYIHNIFAVPPLNEKKRSEKKRFGLF